jgi:hypothetical protein
MELFSEQLSDNEKEEALALVNHLQTMLSYQQLAMEIFNDTASSSTGTKIPQGGEVFRRTGFISYNPAIVARYIIPALEKKIEIYQLIEIKHREASVLAAENLQQPYQDMTSLINAMLDRARFMHQGFKQWVNNEIMNFNATILDEDERVAMYRAINSLNELIYKKIGLTYDEWLDIDQKSINSVRVSVKLIPLTKDIFRSRFMRALTGESVRYFSD